MRRLLGLICVFGLLMGPAAALAQPLGFSAMPICTSVAAISQTGDAQVITGASGQYIKVCSIVLIASAAETVNIVEGTGTTCGTGTVALFGSTTEASGMAIAANGGFAQVGMAPFLRTQSPGTNLCITQVGTSRIAGAITYIVSP